MRSSVLALTVALGLLLAPVSLPGSSAPLMAVNAEAGSLSAMQPEIDVDVDREADAWYTSPVWLAIGAIALVLIIVLIAMAVRGGSGTTVIKE